MIMNTGDLLNIRPTELKFPFELKKQSSCCLQLTNKTDQYVAFKVKTTNPKKYCVRPNTGIVLPGTTYDVTVTMQAQKEGPTDMQCKDKFLLQSVVTEHGAKTKDIILEMFNKAPGKVIEEFKLRVVYIPANPPSPVPEEAEEGSSPRSSIVENRAQSSSTFDDVSRSYEEPVKENPSEALTQISVLNEQKTNAIQQNQELQEEQALNQLSVMNELKTNAIQQNQKLQDEVEVLRFGVNVMFVILVALLGILIWDLIKMRQTENMMKT